MPIAVLNIINENINDNNGCHLEQSSDCKSGLDFICFYLAHDLMYIYIDCFTLYYDWGYTQIIKSGG